MTKKNIVSEEALIDETDYDFVCRILKDIDVSDEYPLYKSGDPLVRWCSGEMREREYSQWVLYEEN